jgi:hypothetical protein
MSETRTEKMARLIEEARGRLEIVLCNDCPFCLGEGPLVCALTVTPTMSGGVQWRYVHGNAVPPSWCPIRKHDGVSLRVEVAPSPDHWHRG